MAWADASARIIAIVEGTTLSTDLGMPPSFAYLEEASELSVPDSRTFWLEIRGMEMKGNVTLGLPRWFNFDVALVVAYRLDSDPARLFDAIALDWEALMQRLPDVSLWVKASSTIEGLFVPEAETLVGAEVDVTDTAVMVSTSMQVTFRKT